MCWSSRWARVTCPLHPSLVLGSILLSLSRAPGASAQDSVRTGSISGTVADDRGLPLTGAEVSLVGSSLATQTGSKGRFSLLRAPAGTLQLQARLLGYRPQTISLTVEPGRNSRQDFVLQKDLLELQTIVVTGTQTPRVNLDASVAVTTLAPVEIDAAAPRSTTEMLRYVPGFTRVESSGGEVNENISIRGIMGVEYVAFLEDGLPVFPTMHSFFMNADNLFRYDANIERIEVIRGGSSPLFGSNTPGAIVNFINGGGGDVFQGTMRAAAGTEGLARYDLNLNGPIGDDWRFSVGGFYRYDHGVRDPGYAGIQGGQLKASLTRRLERGSVHLSVKHIDDRNQFIVPLPFRDPLNPDYVPGFSDYGSMNTPEGVGAQVPIPTGTLKLPLDDGIKTQGTWVTVEASVDLSQNWQLSDAVQVMRNQEQFNTLLPYTVMTSTEYLTAPRSDGGLELPPGSVGQYSFANHSDGTGNALPFDTPNGLVAPGALWHVEKPVTAVQNQFTVRRALGRHSLSAGAYLARYTQDNHWYFSDILTDVRDNPRFLDLVVTPAGAGTPVALTQGGFRNFLSQYVNGTGHTSIASGVIGAELQLSRRLRADLGARVEYNAFVQRSENVSLVDLDGDSTTFYDIEVFGNNSFRDFNLNVTDWSASLGLNYKLDHNVSLYAAGSRGYKMPAMDQLLLAEVQERVDLFESQRVLTAETGFKYAAGRSALTLGGFYTKLGNLTDQVPEIDPVTGRTKWRVIEAPENRAFGVEIEALITPYPGVQLFGNATILRAELGEGIDSLVGKRVELAPTTIGNLVAIYSPRRVSSLQVKADWHWVGSRLAENPLTRVEDAKLPAYSYFNFGLGLTLPKSAIRISADLVNAFQSKGLEEGNPHLVGAGPNSLFLARPLLPRRLQLSVNYDFGHPGSD